MIHWPKRISNWRLVLVHGAADAPLWWRLRYYTVSAWKMARALASGPVPDDVWRDRMRVCLRCPVLDRETMACRRVLQSGQILGCQCYTPFLALTAAPHPAGCWARSITEHEGWPSFQYPSTRAKARAVLGFVFRN